MKLDGRGCHHQLFSNLLVRSSLRQQTEHLLFSLTQRVKRRIRLLMRKAWTRCACLELRMRLLPTESWRGERGKHGIKIGSWLE